MTITLRNGEVIHTNIITSIQTTTGFELQWTVPDSNYTSQAAPQHIESITD